MAASITHAQSDGINPRGKRIVLFTWGSFGDLHPYIALAQGLKARGHRPAIATVAFYRAKIEGMGLDFYPLRPNLPAFDKVPQLAKRWMQPRNGTKAVVKETLMPALREMYEDAVTAAQGADLLLSHPITYAVPIVAEKYGIPWLSTVLQPIAFVSVFDPPTPAGTPGQIGSLMHQLPPGAVAGIVKIAKFDTLRWAREVPRLRTDLDLPRGKHPIFEGQFSPFGTLALFSPALGKPQTDWPQNTTQTGFCFYDRLSDTEAALEPALEAFLAAGEPPIVFTLGTAAVLMAGDFFRQSAEAARILRRRAILLIGKDPRNRPDRPLPDGVVAFEYAPYGELMRRAAVVVHQGGVGTTGQALNAGRPQLVVPFAHDQPDHADRVFRLGVGRTVPRLRYQAKRVARELKKLLYDPRYAIRAAEVGRQVRAEDGIAVACDRIEQVLRDTVNAPRLPVGGDVSELLGDALHPTPTTSEAAAATVKRLIRRGRARLRLLTGTSSVYLKRFGYTSSFLKRLGDSLNDRH